MKLLIKDNTNLIAEFIDTPDIISSSAEILKLVESNARSPVDSMKAIGILLQKNPTVEGLKEA